MSDLKQANFRLEEKLAGMVEAHFVSDALTRDQCSSDASLDDLQRQW